MERCIRGEKETETESVGTADDVKYCPGSEEGTWVVGSPFGFNP